VLYESESALALFSKCVQTHKEFVVFSKSSVVSVVTPTDCWLNDAYCTLQDFQSSHLIVWIPRGVWETCVAFFNSLPGKKNNCNAIVPLCKKKVVMFTTVTMSAYQSQLNAGVLRRNREKARANIISFIKIINNPGQVCPKNDKQE